MQVPTSNGRADWYVVNTLAAITSLMLAIGLALNVLQLVRGDFSIEPPEPGGTREVLLVLGVMVAVVALFAFWIRMLADFFRHRPAANPVAWGFALLLFSFAAALVNFWKYWRPRHEPSGAPAA